MLRSVKRGNSNAWSDTVPNRDRPPCHALPGPVPGTPGESVSGPVVPGGVPAELHPGLDAGQVLQLAQPPLDGAQREVELGRDRLVGQPGQHQGRGSAGPGRSGRRVPAPSVGSAAPSEAGELERVGRAPDGLEQRVERGDAGRCAAASRRRARPPERPPAAPGPGRRRRAPASSAARSTTRSSSPRRSESTSSSMAPGSSSTARSSTARIRTPRSAAAGSAVFSPGGTATNGAVTNIRSSAVAACCTCW